MLRAEQVQLRQLRTVVTDEAVQYDGMAIDEESMPVSAVLGHEDSATPSLVRFVVASIVGLHLQRVGQHIAYALVTVLLDDAFGAALLEVHPVKVPADGQLYGTGTGTVAAEIGTPQLQFAPVPRLLCRVGVHLLI